MTPVRWLYRLLLRQQVTVGRGAVVGFMAVLTFVINVGIRVGVDNDADRLDGSIGTAWGYGIGLLVPIISLVLASSALGELAEDETLVYLWHRPTPRWMLAVAAWGATVTVAVPSTVLPIALSTFIGTGDATATLATGTAALLGTLAYTSVFVLLGLIVRRALIWGLVYVFIWEQFVARIGGNSSKVSIGAYPSSVLQELTDIELPRADRGLALGLIVPLVLMALGILATARALDRIDVA